MHCVSLLKMATEDKGLNCTQIASLEKEEFVPLFGIETLNTEHKSEHYRVLFNCSESDSYDALSEQLSLNSSVNNSTVNSTLEVDESIYDFYEVSRPK